MRPAGFTIRRATPEDAGNIARVKIQGWREAYTGLVPDQILDQLDLDDNTRRWREVLCADRPNTAIFVSEIVGGPVVGFIDCGPLRHATEGAGGEILALYVLQSAQRRGIGRSLMGAGAESLRFFDMTQLTAWVLAENWPARGFYEALGGAPTAEKPVTIGRTLSEVSYFWRDTSRLAAG